jgi:hypothetical protein
MWLTLAREGAIDSKGIKGSYLEDHLKRRNWLRFLALRRGGFFSEWYAFGLDKSQSSLGFSTDEADDRLATLPLR